MLAASLCRALSDAQPGTALADVQVRAFLMSQLELVGDDASVPTLSALLSDEDLCEPATQALLAIGTPAAAETLGTALSDATEATAVTLIKATGELRYAPAVPTLLHWAIHPDRKVRLTSLYALANIGAPEAAGMLAAAADNGRPYERMKATSLYLLYIRRLAAQGKEKQARRACRDLLKTHHDPGESNVRAAALAFLAQSQGRTAKRALLAAAESSDKEYRNAALDLACEIPGERFTKQWMKKAKRGTPDARADILAMLGRRNDKAALPLALKALDDAEQPVRMAAIDASAQLGGGAAAPGLLKTLKRAKAAEERDAAKCALLRLPTDSLVPAVAEALPNSPADAKPALLDILAARRATEQLDTVFAAIESEDEAVRIAAFNALGVLASEGDLGRLFGLLAEAPSEAEEAAAQDAVVAVVEQIPDSEGFIELFNGVDLTGWRGDTDGYSVEDGVLLCRPGGNLFTVDEYDNFILRFEFKLTPGANNGLGIHVPAKGHPSYDGIELQILDDSAEKYAHLKPYQHHGSVYGVVPAKTGSQNDVGEWNVEEVIVKGPRIIVNLNGTTIVGADVVKAATPGPMDGHEHPGLLRETGYIGFLGHGDVLEFRNIRVKPLK